MLRLATTLRPKSYWRAGYHLAYLLAILAIGIMTALPWWAVIAMAIIAILVYSYASRWTIATQPLHLTAAHPTDYNSHWQLLFAGRYRDELWEADLMTAKRIGHCIHLVFAVVHPEYKQQVVVLWQDQVSADMWRQLNILARWS